MPTIDTHSDNADRYIDDLRLALHLADLSDSLTTARFGALDLRVTDKPDLSPVTDADLTVERELRSALTRSRPADAILGEEFGGGSVPIGRQWVIDPIDGTKNYVRGIPAWATLIAMLVDRVPVVGVVSAPALMRRWWAAADRGAYRRVGSGESERVAVSKIGSLEAACLSISSLSGWHTIRRRDNLIGLTDAVWRVRGFGDFWSYCLVAEGAADIAAEPEVSLWDLAALDIIVREAGGRFTALDGTPGPHGGSAVATNGPIHDAVLERLNNR